MQNNRYLENSTTNYVKLNTEKSKRGEKDINSLENGLENENNEIPMLRRYYSNNNIELTKLSIVTVVLIIVIGCGVILSLKH